MPAIPLAGPLLLWGAVWSRLAGPKPSFQLGGGAQIWGSCVASANSPLALVRRGLRQWLELGAPAEKLVLGLPW